MKKRLSVLILIMIMVITCAVRLSHIYEVKGTISNISNENITEITDENGNIWEWDGYCFAKETKVILLMHNNSTKDTIFDDSIFEIRQVN